jgi:hypothetical protein
MSASAVETVVASREIAERACRILVASSPEALEGCASLLEAAVRSLRSARVAPGDVQARAEVRHLAAAVRQAGALLQNAADYHGGWNRWLGARTAGYQAGGVPAGMARPASVCLEG